MRILVYRPDLPSGVRIWATLSVVPFTDNPKLLSVVTSYRVFDLLTHMFSIFSILSYLSIIHPRYNATTVDKTSCFFSFPLESVPSHHTVRYTCSKPLCFFVGKLENELMDFKHSLGLLYNDMQVV